MQLLPEQIAKALVNEIFHSRRMVVFNIRHRERAGADRGIAVAQAVYGIDQHSRRRKNDYPATDAGSRSGHDALDRSRNAREIIFGRKIMDAILEYGGWLVSNPNVEERALLIDDIKKRTFVNTVGKNILRIEYRTSNRKGRSA